MPMMPIAHFCPRRCRVRGLWGRIFLLMFASLAGLQILHIMMLNQLEAMETEQRRTKLNAMNQDLRTLFMAMKHTLESREVIDYTGKYQIVNYLYGRRKRPMNPEVTLVSQCSVNHLHHLIALAERWRGPMSVSVFNPNTDIVPAVSKILRLVQCVPELRYNLTVHLVFPFRGALIRLPSTPPENEHNSCGDLMESLLKNQSSPNYEGVQYPNNLLRNIAWRNSWTEYVFVIDIDMVPSAHLRQDFLEFAQKRIILPQPAGIVYVVPAFEMDNRMLSVPAGKSTLMNMWNQGLMRPFYHEVCWKCQRHTDYEAWRDLTLEQSMRVGYEVDWKDPWEPFFIAPAAGCPRYDERFRQYGFNRISQVCEVHLAGYKFAVLNNAFLVHRGFKTEDGFHSSKKEEMDRNRAHYRTFKLELKKKYPDTNRTCYYRKE